jgi:membrane protease YdiL (CAAX protease family)
MAGAGVEAQLQLILAFVSGLRGTVFLLLGALAWIVTGFAGAMIAAAILGLGSVLLRRLPGLAFIPGASQLVIVLVAATVFQGTLLLVALRQGRLTGGGDRRSGLGFRPIRRGGRVVLLCASMIALLLIFVLLAARLPALREFARSVTPDVLAGLGEGGPAVTVLKVVLVVALAPASEELFFRGWLWEALRHRGRAISTTACLTAMPWLLLHGIDSPGRILFLIPAAVVFSLARHQGGGVLASLAVHVTNNTTAVLMQAMAMLFGQQS